MWCVVVVKLVVITIISKHCPTSHLTLEERGGGEWGGWLEELVLEKWQGSIGEHGRGALATWYFQYSSFALQVTFARPSSGRAIAFRSSFSLFSYTILLLLDAAEETILSNHNHKNPLLSYTTKYSLLSSILILRMDLLLLKTKCTNQIIRSEILHEIHVNIFSYYCENGCCNQQLFFPCYFLFDDSSADSLSLLERGSDD